MNSKKYIEKNGSVIDSVIVSTEVSTSNFVSVVVWIIVVLPFVMVIVRLPSTGLVVLVLVGGGSTTVTIAKSFAAGA